MPVHVDEEGPEPLKMKVNLGGDVWRTHALYHEGFVAIHPHWEAVGSRIQTVRAFREGNLGSYDPLFRPFSVTRLPAPFTEETFREWNRYQLAASTLAVVANSGESDLKRATPRSCRVAFSSRRGNGCRSKRSGSHPVVAAAIRRPMHPIPPTVPRPGWC